MRFFFLLFVATSALLSCKQSAIQSRLAKCDSLTIEFYEPRTSAVVKTVATAEKSAIRRLSQFVDGKEVQSSNCGNDGKLIFFSDGQKEMEITFQSKIDSCRNFTFQGDEQFNGTRKMSNEAADFLKSLSMGMSWY